MYLEEELEVEKLGPKMDGDVDEKVEKEEHDNNSLKVEEGQHNMVVGESCNNAVGKMAGKMRRNDDS